MKILVMGAGKMGSFFIDLLSFDHEVAVFEKNPMRMRFTYNCQRFTSFDGIKEFRPELVINAVTLKYTIPVFNEVIPYLPKECIISDIASVKTDLTEYYETTGMRYVSTHPMFGPTFANLQQLSEENAIIISEGDFMGRCFFKELYRKLGLNIYEYTFEEHDKTVAYSLSIPFVSTFVFAAVMKHQDAPGTTLYSTVVWLLVASSHSRHQHRLSLLRLSQPSEQPSYYVPTSYEMAASLHSSVFRSRSATILYARRRYRRSSRHKLRFYAATASVSNGWQPRSTDC